MMTLQRLTEIVIEAGRLMEGSDFEIREKNGCSNIVTSTDVAVQELLRDRLSKVMPGSGFLCEEEEMHDLRHENVWIIDPIDGTANFSRGIAQCAVCVGLKQGESMMMGVVWLPRTGELFAAERGRGAWLNGKRISVSEREFGNAVMCTSLPVYHKEYTGVCASIITEAFLECNDLRRFGAAAPELCYLAMGRCELYFEYLLSPWDFAAASLILEEAGGFLGNLRGESLDMTRPSGVVAANSRENFEKLTAIVGRHLD